MNLMVEFKTAGLHLLARPPISFKLKPPDSRLHYGTLASQHEPIKWQGSTPLVPKGRCSLQGNSRKRCTAAAPAGAAAAAVALTVCSFLAAAHCCPSVLAMYEEMGQRRALQPRSPCGMTPTSLLHCLVSVLRPQQQAQATPTPTLC